MFNLTVKKMELIFLGTSSAIPTNHRNHSAIAMKSFGEIMLFDCGEGTQRQMSRARLSPMKVDKIFITHFHGDHFLGVPGMVQSMAFRGRKEPLHIFGPEGLSKIVEKIKGLGYFSMSFDICVHEIPDGIPEGYDGSIDRSIKDDRSINADETELNEKERLNEGLFHEIKILEEEDYIVTCCKVEHSVPNLAYCITEKRAPKFIKEKALKLGVKPGPDFGKLQQGIPVKVGNRIINPLEVLGSERQGRKIVYSGDTQPCDQMIKFAEDATVLIHESTFDSQNENKAYETGHSTAAKAAEIADKANVKKLILTHISTRYKETSTLEKEAIDIFENSVLAEDLMSIEVERSDS